jgi:hypothetical protein
MKEMSPPTTRICVIFCFDHTNETDLLVNLSYGCLAAISSTWQHGRKTEISLYQQTDEHHDSERTLPQRRIFLEKLISAELVKKFCFIYEI